MKVPFLDLRSQIKSIRTHINSAFARVMESGIFILGKETEGFEREFARYCGARYCVAVNSGTSALHVALLAHEIQSGDEVITQPNTFIATCEAIAYVGAKPVFADIDPVSYTLDASGVERAITKKTKAIIPVHLYGNASDMNALLRIARKHNIAIIEDAAQAHGAKYRGKTIGSFGNTTCFSFYPSKVLGAYGEGGAVLTNSKKMEKAMRALRDHGQISKHAHGAIGYNYRIQELQAAFLRIKLKYLNSWIALRRKNARKYNTLLKSLSANVRLPVEPPHSFSSMYVYVIRCRQRDELASYLAQHGVQTQIHYPTPVHLQKAFFHLGYKKGDFPVAEQCAKEILSLPMYPELTDGQIRYVTSHIKKFYEA